MNGLFRRQKAAWTAVVDIDSGSVGVAILESAPTGFSIIGMARSTFPLEERGAGHMVAAVAGHLEDAAKKALTETHSKDPTRPVATVYAFVGAPWCSSATANESIEHSEDTTITEHAIAELAHKAAASLRGTSQGAPLEAAVIRVELNGYPTAAPEGKYARTMSVSVIVSDCDADLRIRVGDTLASLFPSSEVRWRSGVRAVTTVVREIGAPSDNYIIVEMGGEGTDLSIVQTGILTRHVIAPLGVRSMLEKIMPGGLPEDTLTTIRHVVVDQCDDAACKLVAEGLAKAEPGFVRSFGEALGKNMPRQRLPNTLILLAESDIIPWLGRFFGRIDFSQFTGTMQPFSVVELTEHDVEPLLLSGKAPARHDIGLELGVALVNIEQREA